MSNKRRRAAGAAPLVGAFLQAAESTTDTGTYTFSTQNIGVASADRRIIVGVMGSQADVTISSISVGGVACDLVVQLTGGSGATCGIGIAAVPTGTTGDVVVTFSATEARCAIALWHVTGLSSNTALDFGSSSADPGADTVTTRANGFVVAVAKTVTSGATLAWTNVSERAEAVLESAAVYGAADAAPSGTSLAVSCDGLTNARRAMVVASW